MRVGPHDITGDFIKRTRDRVSTLAVSHCAMSSAMFKDPTKHQPDARDMLWNFPASRPRR